MWIERRIKVMTESQRIKVMLDRWAADSHLWKSVSAYGIRCEWCGICIMEGQPYPLHICRKNPKILEGQR